MKLGYTIIYVADVPATIEFFGHAFGLKHRFIHESQLYGELDTGETVLAFASEQMADLNGIEIRPNRKDAIASGFEVALVTDDPHSAYTTAVEAGADPVSPPTEKPWGQVVAYVRDLNGCLIEICSPVGIS